MKVRVSCQDKYEAQKLASLVFLKDSNDTFITEILNIIQNEMVVALRDKSAHSVMLKDEINVEILADFLQSVIEKKHHIVGTRTVDVDVEITKA